MSVRSAVFAVVLVGAASGCMSPKPPVAAAAKPDDHRSAEQRRVYRLDFVVASIDPGKAPVTSTHTLNLEEFSNGEIRMGSNIPISPQARQDVGLLIRSSFIPVADDLLLDSTFEMSSAEDGPAIRKLAVRGNAVVTPGKPALVASAEDPTSHKRFEVTVTATKLR